MTVPPVRSTRRAVAAGFAVLLLSCVLFVLRAPLWTGNFHSVIPGEVYRSGQLDTAELDEAIREYGIRSIINLRTPDSVGSDSDDYRVQAAFAAARGVAHRGIRMSARRLTPRGKLRDLIEALDRAERPLLIHCRAGTDRTGFVSAVAVLLHDANVDRARQEFGLRHGHFSLLSLSDLDSWLDLYEAWLASQGSRSSSALVREFAHSGYTPYFYDAHIEPVSLPNRFEVRNPHRLVFRVTNESPLPWTFTPASPLGVHLGLRVKSLDPSTDYTLELRGDTPDLLFPPGESIELSATLPGLPEVGRYRVTVDLVDESVVWFAQMGSTPFEMDVDALAPAGPNS